MDVSERVVIEENAIHLEQFTVRPYLQLLINIAYAPDFLGVVA